MDGKVIGRRKGSEKKWEGMRKREIWRSECVKTHTNISIDCHPLKITPYFLPCRPSFLLFHTFFLCEVTISCYWNCISPFVSFPFPSHSVILIIIIWKSLSIRLYNRRRGRSQVDDVDTRCGEAKAKEEFTADTGFQLLHCFPSIVSSQLQCFIFFSCCFFVFFMSSCWFECLLLTDYPAEAVRFAVSFFFEGIYFLTLFFKFLVRFLQLFFLSSLLSIHFMHSHFEHTSLECVNRERKMKVWIRKKSAMTAQKRKSWRKRIQKRENVVKNYLFLPLNACPEFIMYSWTFWCPFEFTWNCFFFQSGKRERGDKRYILKCVSSPWISFSFPLLWLLHSSSPSLNLFPRTTNRTILVVYGSSFKNVSRNKMWLERSIALYGWMLLACCAIVEWYREFESFQHLAE